MYDVGDAVELTLTTTPGATVKASWVSPSGQLVLDNEPVPESTTVPGDYPYTFMLTEPNVWEARFQASGTVTQFERFYLRARPAVGPPPLATPDEVVELFRPLSLAEESTAASLLRRASALVRGRFPDVDARIAAGTLDGEQAGLAVINMVLRVMANPERLRSETTGPFTRSYDPVAAAGYLELSEAEDRLLTPAAAATGVAATISVKAGLGPCEIGTHPALGVVYGGP